MTTEREAGGPATLADVAAAAGVSIPTASKALADRYDVAAGTKERVLRAAEALSFSPNVLARGLLTGRTQTVGIITSDIEGRFVPSIMLGAEDTLGADSSNVILCNSRGREDLEQHHARALLGRRVDGLIVVGNYPETRPPLKVRTRVPVVYVFAPCEDEDATSYVCDNRASARAATQAVIDSGKRRIAHVAGPRDAAAAQERAAGTLEALHDAGLEPIGGEPIWGDWLQRWGWDAVDRLLADRADFDAVVCGDDQIGRLCSLAQRGYDHVEFVGDDLAGDGGDSRLAEQRGDGGAGEVLPRAREAAITDGDHHGSGCGGKFRGHLFSLRPLEQPRAKQHRPGLTIVRR